MGDGPFPGRHITTVGHDQRSPRGMLVGAPSFAGRVLGGGSSRQPRSQRDRADPAVRVMDPRRSSLAAPWSCPVVGGGADYACGVPGDPVRPQR
jgi:hypothetical protein